MSNLLMINKHGSNIPVYDINNDSRQIGYLNNREAFVQYSTNGSNRLYIYFLDGSGISPRVLLRKMLITIFLFTLSTPSRKSTLNGISTCFLKCGRVCLFTTLMVAVGVR